MRAPRSFVVAGALLGAAASSAPALAGMPYTERMTCPLDGKSFEYTTTMSYSTFGSRPDGKPYGSWTFPLALPECPDSGFVVYRNEFSSEQIERLKPLVASDAYRAMRRAEMPYYRAYWLMKEMGDKPEDYLWTLLQASWQAEGKAELKSRYQAEFAEASAALPARPDDIDWIALEVRAVNALRELGRFDEALARLDRLPLRSLDVASGAEGEEADNRRSWRKFIAQLRPVIERHDRDSEPLDIVPSRIAVSICVDRPETLSVFAKTYCEKEAAEVERLRRSRAPSR